MKKIYLLLIVFVGAFAYSATAQDDEVMMVIPKNGAATVDAFVDPDDDPWQDDAWIEYDVTDKPSNTTFDASARFQMSWDDDFISVVFEVQDATENMDPAAIEATHERDNVEIFFHMSAEKPTETAYETHTWQIRFQRDNHLVEPDRLIEAEGFEVETFPESTMYTIEANIPFATLADESGWTTADEFFYMHTSVGDNTTGAAGGRTQQLFWLEHNEDNMWQDKTLFKRVQLGPGTVGINSKVANVEASAYVHNNTLKLKNVQGEIAIYNINGAMVKKAMVNPGQSSMDISDLKTGVYVVRGKNLAAKIVK